MTCSRSVTPDSVQHPPRIIGRAHPGRVAPWTLNQVQGDDWRACGAAPRLSAVMLNLVQHPGRIIGRARAGRVAPWTLNRVQGDEYGELA